MIQMHCLYGHDLNWKHRDNRSHFVFSVKSKAGAENAQKELLSTAAQRMDPRQV